MLEFIALAQQCAPDVHITTLSAVVRHESGFNPLIIGVNGKPHRTIRPATEQEAIQTAHQLIRDGTDFDVGYGQINVRNWKWLGVTPETIFNPCVNLQAAQRVLVDCYQRAAKVYPAGQNALYAAFSCYNTGNFERGFSNGYVNKVIAGAGITVPAIQPDKEKPTTQVNPQPPSTQANQTRQADAFSRATSDAFATPTRDAFNKPANTVFGDRIPVQPRTR